MMTIYTHRNMQQCYKKQVLLLYIVHLLDKCSNILQNARYIHQGDQCTLFYSLYKKGKGKGFPLQTRYGPEGG